VDYCIILALLFAGTGCGITVINNLGSMVQSLGGQPNSQLVYVVLFSTFNCKGRLLAGWASDQSAARLTRPEWLVAALCSSVGAMVLVAFADLTWLLVGAAWAGLSFGAFWSLGPALVADRFGERAFAPVYALSSIATGLASYLLSTLLAAGLYQRQLDAAAAEGTVCLGQACFRDAFLTIAGIAVLAALLASFFSRKLRSLYRGPQGRALRYDAFVSSYKPWRCGRRLDASCARARRSK